MQLKDVVNELSLSEMQITRLANDKKIVRYHKNHSKMWEYDDESVFVYKHYLEEKQRLAQRYNTQKTVIKRNKSIAKFHRENITNAVTKAFDDVYSNIEDHITKIDQIVDLTINKLLRQNKMQFDITEIQSAVEQSLVDVEEFKVAEAYTAYRLQHDINRKKQTSVDYQINKLLKKDDDVVNENANKDADVYATKRDLTAGAVSKAIGLKILPKKLPMLISKV